MDDKLFLDKIKSLIRSDDGGLCSISNFDVVKWHLRWSKDGKEHFFEKFFNRRDLVDILESSADYLKMGFIDALYAHLKEIGYLPKVCKHCGQEIKELKSDLSSLPVWVDDSYVYPYLCGKNGKAKHEPIKGEYNDPKKDL